MLYVCTVCHCFNKMSCFDTGDNVSFLITCVFVYENTVLQYGDGGLNYYGQAHPYPFQSDDPPWDCNKLFDCV
jgi:hypothetical protein